MRRSVSGVNHVSHFLCFCGNLLYNPYDVGPSWAQPIFGVEFEGSATYILILHDTADDDSVEVVTTNRAIGYLDTERRFKSEYTG